MSKAKRSSDEGDLSENMTLAELTDNNLRNESPERDQSEKAAVLMDTLDCSVASSAGETMDSCQESGSLAVQEIPKDACFGVWQIVAGLGSCGSANLVNLKLGVDKKFLHEHSDCHWEQGEASLLDANHCPGAVMFLFQVGKRRILHVGDFRWNKDFMLQHSPLRSIALRQSQLDDIFLDTTYCNDKYALPTQEETILATVELAEKEVARCRRQKLRLLMFVWCLRRSSCPWQRDLG